jgi:hypothetical protein
MPARTAPTSGERFNLCYRISDSTPTVAFRSADPNMARVFGTALNSGADDWFAIPVIDGRLTPLVGWAHAEDDLAQRLPEWRSNAQDRLLFEMRNAGIWFSDLATLFEMPSAAATSARYNRICRLNNVTDAYQGERQRNRTAPSGRRLRSNRFTHFGTLNEIPEWVACFDDLGWVNEHSDQLAFAVELELAGLTPHRACEVISPIVPTHPDTSYRHTVYPTQWKCVPDGSVPNGCEIVSPPLRGSDGIDQIRRVCIAVAEAGGRVTVRAGVHVHIGLDDIEGNRVIQPDSEGAQIIFQHAQWQPVWNRLTQVRRHDGRWSRTRVMSRALAMADQWRAGNYADGGNRYFSLNLCSYDKYGTFEFRQHHSSLNPARLATWIGMHLQMITDVNQGTADYRQLSEEQQMRVLNEEQTTLVQHTLTRNLHTTLQTIGTSTYLNR